MADACPSDEVLAAAIGGDDEGVETSQLVAHLDQCERCRRRLEDLAGGTGWLPDQPTAERRAPSPMVRDAIERLSSDTGDELGTEPEFQGIGEETAPGKPAAEAVGVDFLDPPPGPAYIGRFGPYDIVEVVAAGGMGVILRARDPMLQRTVAIKVLSPQLAANATARERFLREARATAAVSHDHVLSIHAVDEANGLPYLVMPFVSGKSLDARLRDDGALEVEEILRIGMQTASGLAAAHAQGLIHRDIKPANILLENSVERVKVTDFGLARAAGDSGVTHAGHIVGTPEFMAPEQANGEAIDFRADLFSLGGVLYAMATGNPPFSGSTTLAIVRKVCDEQPAPANEVNENIPAWLGAAIARLMEKDPAKRFQSADEVQEVLEGALAERQRTRGAELESAAESTEGVPVQGRFRRPVLVRSAAAAVLLGVAIIVGWQVFGPHHPGHDRGRPGRSPLTLAESPSEVLAMNGTEARRFEQLSDAIAAAESGGVIELLWNGQRRVPPIDFGDKALTLRAADGFEPGLSVNSANLPVLSTEAALTIEGLTLRRSEEISMQQVGAADDPAASHPGSSKSLVSCKAGPLFVLNCRLRVSGSKAGLSIHDRESCLHLRGVMRCEIQNSELLAPAAVGISWGSSPHQQPAELRLALRNCVACASTALHIAHFSTSHATLVLSQSTIVANTSVELARVQEKLVVSDGGNVHATPWLFEIVNRRAGHAILENLKWMREGPSCFTAQKFITASDRSVGSLRAWDEFWNLAKDDSVLGQVAFRGTIDPDDTEIGLERRLEDFSIDDITSTRGDRLSPKEIARFGADLKRVGPATPYHVFRKSAAYTDWRDSAR